MAKRTILLLGFTLATILGYSQENTRVEQLCKEAEISASKNNYSSAILKYEEANAIISKSEDATLDLYVSAPLINYIIRQTAAIDTTLAKQYALQALELRNKCFAAAAQMGYFNSKEEFICNVSNEYCTFGSILAESGLLTDAQQCYAVAPAFFKQADILCDEYANTLENVGVFYANYLGNIAQELLFQYEALKVHTSLHGFDSKEYNGTFDRMLSSYATGIGYLSLVGEPGLLNQYADQLPIPDYSTTKQIISVWDDIRDEIVGKYGQAAFDKLIQSHPKAINGNNIVLIGTQETDCLYLSILAILNDKVQEYEKASSAMLKMISNPDIQMIYSEDLVSAMRNSHYINNIYAFYNKLKDFQLKAGRKDNAEKIDIECGLLLYAYGSYDMAWTFCFDVVDQISSQTLPDFININSYLQKVLLASCLWDTHKNNQATSRKYLEIAKKLADDNLANVDPRLHSTIYNNISTLLSSEGAFAKAEEYLRQSIHIYNDYASSIGVDTTDVTNLMWPVGKYTNLSDVYISKREYEKASAILDDCLRFYLHNYPDSPKLTYVYSQEMFIADKLGKKEELADWATKRYNHSIDCYLSNAQSMTKIQRTDYWYNFDQGGLSRMMDIFSDIAGRNENVVGICYDAALTQKGFLLGQDAIIRDNILSSGDADLISAYKSLKEAETKGGEKKNHYENRTMYLYGKHPEFKNSFNRHTWKEVQDKLGKRDVAIEFTSSNFNGKTTYAALILKTDWDSPKYVEMCDGGMLKSFCEKQSVAYKDMTNLYDCIWGNVVQYLKPGDNVYFSPYGLINQINIEVIAGPDGKQANKKYNLFRVSTTGILCENRANDELTSAVLIGGLNFETDTTTMVSRSREIVSYSRNDNPKFVSDASITRRGWQYLPGTKLEVQSIDKILGAKCIKTLTISDENGTEEMFKSLSGGNNGLIHIATHGFYLNQTQADRLTANFIVKQDGDSHIYPLRRSGLIFAGGQHAWLGEDIPDGVDDGILTSEEISGMDLSSTSLLVLSACQTGLGDVSSEGVYGLQRGFKIAGVGTIIMSLWEVNDAATELMMSKFYTALASGKTKRDSFNYAIDAVKSKYDSPEYWAAFIMLD